ncbi:MAG: bifunctional DNA-formamidopyrimidine glycosylase/DNA-(apurinic or apyrimidinic site) lyase [Acidobacteria bacterium]|nr:bifunctional DNA-formamidopyrimidine glycosylase/DNA-(apurinic or apyrimidinic site) lyase [Acidobacteriota bacterium]
MPELPEVEAVCRVVRRALKDRRIVFAEIFRKRICAPQTPSQFARAVAGRRFQSVERRGKNILIHLEGVTLWAHLRMTGDFYPVAVPRLTPPTAAAQFVLDNGRALVFDDPRGLGVLRAVKPAQWKRLLGTLGPDALSPEFTAERFAGLAKSSRAPIKLFLMDQRWVAGLGNIYAAEALFRARIDPRHCGAGLGRARLLRLHRAIVALLTNAVKSASLAYRRPGVFAEGETFRPAVYGREDRRCPACAGLIRRIVQGGRSTFFCPGCQS